MRALAIGFVAILLPSCALQPPARPPASPPAAIPAAPPAAAKTPAADPIPVAPKPPDDNALPRAKAPRPAYNLAGYPPAARDGYIDGCETARESEYARKEANRFAADSLYRMGWKDGFSICSRR